MIIVFDKKRIKILFPFLIIIGIFCITMKTNQEIEEVAAMPAVNKTIILDAGHGLPDEGAVGNDGTSEEKINLDIVMKVQELLEISGVNVVLTRSDENGIYSTDKESIKNKKVSDMKNRVEIGNNSNADIFVSIHLNKFQDEKYKGYQTFYNEKDEKSKELAQIIQKNLKDCIKDENKREALSISNKYIMEKVKIPTTIVECGFLSNNEELKNLKNEEYQQKIAWGIYLGIMEFFEK